MESIGRNYQSILNNMSVTISGLISMAIAWFFREANVEVMPEQLQNFLEVVWLGISAILIWYGRWRKGDINFFGGRKTE